MAVPMTPVSAERERLWTPTYLLLLCSVHFHFASFFMLVSALPLYVKGAKEWEVGLVVGALGVSAILLRPFTGRWVDSIGRRPLMVLGAAITTGASPGAHGAMTSCPAARGSTPK